MHEPLRRHLARGGLVLGPVPIDELQALAAQDRGGDELEVLRLVAARSEGNHADPLAHLVERMVARGEECGEPGLERLHMRAEERGLEALDQVLEGEERLRLARAEPQARQLVLRPLAGSPRLEAIGLLLAVPHDGRVQPASHVLEVALEGGERDAELPQELADLHPAARLQHLVDFVEPFGAVHSCELRLGPRIREGDGRGVRSHVHRACRPGCPERSSMKKARRLSPGKLAR